MSTVKIHTKSSIKEIYSQISKFMGMSDYEMITIANDICNTRSDGVEYVIFDTDTKSIIKAKYVGIRKLRELVSQSNEFDVETSENHIQICETLKFSNWNYPYLFN
jgi:hypothetical protein